MYIEIAKEVLVTEAAALHHVAQKLDANFDGAVQAIVAAKGRTIVCGMGKSGHIGKKIFATLVSTGTPSMFLHPGEAFHGDLGMVLPEDVFLAISNSGETEEILKLVPFIKDSGNILIAMTGNPASSLASVADFHLDIGVEKEACPLQLAPTASTTATLAVGDALAVALMKARDFRAENFARFHPGGSLGRKLLGRVRDFMREIVSVTPEQDFKSVLTAMSQSAGGIICVVKNGVLQGVITDGDIRRSLSRNDIQDVVRYAACDIMTTRPRKVTPDTRCSDADALMNEAGINGLLVEGDAGRFFVYHNLNRK